jgi:diguanylate cyclase (GGDEF)-like protein/PAS domain S-box-containing protein
MKKYKLGLRTKILASLAIGMLTLFAFLFVVSRTALHEGYHKLERDNALVYLNGAAGLMQEQIAQLRSNSTDYAHWDLLYKYAATPDEAFVKENFSDTSFANLKINALIVLNANGEILHSHGVDFATGKPWEIPKLLLQSVAKGGVLVDQKKTEISGLFWTPEGIFIVSSVDIRNSDGEGDRRGTLVMARPLSDDLLKHSSQIIGAKLDIQPMLGAKMVAMNRELAANRKIIEPLNDKLVAGYAMMNDIGGSTKLILSIITNRKIAQLGDVNQKFLYGALLVVALLLVIFSIQLDKIVLARLEKLSESVKKIGEGKVASGRLPELSGNDELTSLAHGINGMLEYIDESQFALKFEKERAQVTLAGIADAVITSDTAGRLLYMNDAAERLTGTNVDDACGKTLQSLFHFMKEDKTTPIDSGWLTDAASAFEEVALERADGVSFVVSKSTSPLYTYNDLLFGHVSVLHDVTMLRSLSNQLSYQARHDSLTGLINRYEFDRMTQAAIEDAVTENRTHCVAFLDLDQFKVVNDSCGHMAGDMLLRQLAEHLKAKLRNADTIARLGGDEFALLLMGCNLKRAEKIVQGLLEAVRDYRFSFDDKVFKVGISIGLVEISLDKNLTLSELLAAADSACYSAKQDGGNRVHTHHIDDKDMKVRNSQLEWVSRIHQALEQQKFVLYSQRMKRLVAGNEQHCELLIRMRGEDNALYPPGVFLPAAERYRLMPQIDRWVVCEALAIVARKGTDFHDVCAINLSGQTLSEDGFLDYVIEQIEKNGVDATRICFEITETAVIANLNKARQFMRALREIGCRFSLDDFGSGLSSFAYLKNLDVDFLKIDGMFVKAIVNNKIDRAMVESINNVGHVMGLSTIAEFAENDEIINMLKEIGVDYAQGYGVAMPELFE